MKLTIIGSCNTINSWRNPINDKTYIVMIVFSWLEPDHVILLCIMKPNSIAMMEVCVAGAIVGVFTTLVYMGVGIAVHYGHCQGVVPPGSTSVIFQSVKAKSASWFQKPLNARGCIGAEGTSWSCFDQLQCLAAVKARVLIAAPTKWGLKLDLSFSSPALW